MEKNNPGMRSPIEVLKDSAYERMTDYQARSYWPSAGEVVVRHIASGTFWKAIYSIREDDSDADLPANWYEVTPRTRTITEYVNAK